LVDEAKIAFNLEGTIQAKNLYSTIKESDPEIQKFGSETMRQSNVGHTQED